MSTGTVDFIDATRQILLSNATLANAGVFWKRAPRTDDVPYILLDVQSNIGTKAFGSANNDAFRTITFVAKSVAAQNGQRDGVDIANELQELVYDLLFKDGSYGSAKARWNSVLSPLGWAAHTPEEIGDIGPYDDRVLELERWHLGHLGRLQIERL